SNHHLHNYGLCCLPELLRLWEYTGDEYYLQRAKDHLFCFRQFIAREDGDFNARRGMVSEQWFHTDWTHPKGFLLPLAHVWCAGWILYANLALREEIGEILVDLERGKVHAFEELEIEAVCGPDGGRLSVGNPWPEEIRPSLRFIGGGARTIRLAVEGEGERMPPMAGRRDMYQLRLAPGGRTVLAWHVTAEDGAACPGSQPLTGGAGRPAGVGG
ncbi:MAG: hypothetical protein ACM3XS_06050, partial [Bacteroidota bacterium]